MAAKEEALVLKYLKKNPGSEALDISFGTDVDESVVKETLLQLQSKRLVVSKPDERGVPSWTLGDPSKSTGAPRPIVASESAPQRIPAPSTFDDSDSSSGGTGKLFVFFIALLFSAISVGVSWYLAGMQIQKAKSAFDLQLKTAQDSVGFYKIETNRQLDSIHQDIVRLQTPPPPPPEPAPTRKAKKSKKGKRR